MVRGAGKDATDLFNEYHRWVNYQGLLEACLVGKLVDGPEPKKPTKPATEFLTPIPVLPPIPSKPPTPSMDFFQTDSKMTLNIYTKRKGLNKDCVTVDNCGEVVKVLVNLSQDEELGFIVHLRLAARVDTKVVLRVGASSGKVELDLVKERHERWPGLGTGLDSHLWCGQLKDISVTYRPWVVREVRQVTHDTKQFLLDPPAGTLFSVPLGHHIHINAEVEGVELTRSYTPVRPLSLESDPNTGHLQLLVKIYPEGAVTPCLDRLTEGDTVQISDHTGDFSLSQLEGRGKVFLLAAGTGCTPIFSLLPLLLTIPGTDITLLYFNKTREDIIWREELASLQLQREELRVVHVLSQEPDYTPGGRVNRELLAGYLGEAGGEGGRFAAVCGPVGFNKEAERLLKEEFGFLLEELHLFQG